MFRSVATQRVRHPPQPHLVEHRHLHPWLEVGRGISELIKAALLLLLLTHTVIKRRRALRHTICNIYNEAKETCGAANFMTRFLKSHRCRHNKMFLHDVLTFPDSSFPTDNNLWSWWPQLSPLSTLWSLRRPTRSSPMGVLWERAEGRNLADTAR